ncbi:tyrosine-type recombinase/integrase [Streptomyces sp. NPDC053541]|uniref:tyrosine-type recombinase/integrase n=1 Tax=Streptomyces sp. NPDC053541 TaxID=3365709 RepID=UPI0037D57166
MASVHPRENRNGEITSYQVKWRQPGPDGKPTWQTEKFDGDDEGLDAADLFKQAVDEAGQRWPPGWVKGQGYIDPAAEEPDDARYRFEVYALESVRNRTGVEEYYRDAIEKELRTYLLPTFAHCDVRSTEHFSKRTVQQWVNRMAETKVWRGSQHKFMSPKTLRNLHGLLSSILKEATQEEPPLRLRNPCELVTLPRIDDGGVEDDGSDEDMCFLEPHEVQAIVDALDRPEDKKLVRRKYATGLRWSELTALAKRQILRDPKDGKPKIRVTRAWKRRSKAKGGGYYLGTPKSKRSRRTIRLDEVTYQELLDDGLESLKAENLVHHNGKGERLPYSTVYDRWLVAVEKAHAAGALPLDKHPTLHDLRHSHAAALLSAGRSLTYVQRRLGHESITTTSDRYGHLLPEADDDAMETIVKTLGGPPAPSDSDVEEVPYELSERAAAGSARRVYVVHFGAHKEGFWDLDDAQAVSRQWELDKGEAALVEVWSADWWQRTVGGGLNGGLNKVRHQVPERLQVWHVGPALYSADGTEHVVCPDDHEPRASWVWEWEERFTEEPFVRRAEWRPSGETEAEAWGLSRSAVVAAYEQARADALRVCGLNPALKTGEPEGGRESIR